MDMVLGLSTFGSAMGIRNDSWFCGGVERFCYGRCTSLVIMNWVEPQFDGGSVVRVCLAVPKMI